MLIISQYCYCLLQRLTELPQTYTSTPYELAKIWAQVDHSLIIVIHYCVYGIWKAAVEQLAEINRQPIVLQSTQEHFQKVDVLNKACRF